MVARGGVHGWQGSVCGYGGACVVARGHVWLAGGMHGCQGACVVARGLCIGYDEIRSMSGWYASYWNAFLLEITLVPQ